MYNFWNSFLLWKYKKYCEEKEKLSWHGKYQLLPCKHVLYLYVCLSQKRTFQLVWPHDRPPNKTIIISLCSWILWVRNLNNEVLCFCSVISGTSTWSFKGWGYLITGSTNHLKSYLSGGWYGELSAGLLAWRTYASALHVDTWAFSQHGSCVPRTGTQKNQAELYHFLWTSIESHIASLWSKLQTTFKEKQHWISLLNGKRVEISL